MESTEAKPKQRGGARPGAGRPPGSHNAMSKAAREAAQATGKLPHEILLSIARGEPQEVVAINAQGQRETKLLPVTSLDDVRSAAQAAAPYYAPKISTVEVVGSLSDDNLDELIARAAEEAGVSLAAVGEGAESGGAESTEATHPAPRARVRLE